MIARASKERVGRGLGFLGAFGSAKGFAFVGPVFLSQVMAPADFGAVELGLSVGILAATVLSLGVAAAVPQKMLVLGDRRALDILFFYSAGTAALGLALAGLLHWFGADVTWLLSAGLIGLFAGQLSASVYFRTTGQRNLASWSDNLTLVIVTAGALSIWAITGNIALADIAGAALICTGFLAVGASVCFSVTRQPEFGRAYRGSIALGFFMMTNGLVMYALTAGQRIVLAALVPMADVGAFALCARIALILVLVHQAAFVAFFVRIYELPRAGTDRWMSGGLCVLTVLAAISVVVVDHGAEFFLAHGGFDPEHIVRLYPLVAGLTLYVILSAQLETMINREGRSRGSMAALAVLAGIAAAAFFGWGRFGAPDAASVIIALGALAAAAVAVQLSVLARSGFRLPRVAMVMWAPAALGLLASAGR